MRILHCRFERYNIGQIYSGDFAKICGLLRIHELYLALKYLPNHVQPRNGVLNHTFSKKNRYFFLLLRTKIHGSRGDYNGINTYFPFQIILGNWVENPPIQLVHIILLCLVLSAKTPQFCVMTLRQIGTTRRFDLLFWTTRFLSWPPQFKILR